MLILKNAFCLILLFQGNKDISIVKKPGNQNSEKEITNNIQRHQMGNGSVGFLMAIGGVGSPRFESKLL